MTDLAKAAMLVSVTIINGGLLGERRDKTATSYVERKFKLQAQHRAKASKYLIDRKHPRAKAVVAAAQRVREVLYKYTMPWGDDKMRLLPTSLHEVFKKKVSEAEAELREAWSEYVQVYPALISASERELGDLFDKNEYPSPSRVADLFGFRLNYWPLPLSGHFVADIAQDAATRAKATMELEIETRLRDATQDIVERARESVNTYIEKLSNYREDSSGKVEGVFRDSLVSNILELSALVHAMNITNNHDIRMAADKLRSLSYRSAEVLRVYPDLRAAGVVEAKGIIAALDNLDLADLDVATMVAEASEHMDF